VARSQVRRDGEEALHRRAISISMCLALYFRLHHKAFRLKCDKVELWLRCYQPAIREVKVMKTSPREGELAKRSGDVNRKPHSTTKPSEKSRK
jgi:hypothetical protein